MPGAAPRLWGCGCGMVGRTNKSALHRVYMLVGCHIVAAHLDKVVPVVNAIRRTKSDQGAGVSRERKWCF